jgi:uncharacterized protein (DUF1697 family)
VRLVILLRGINLGRANRLPMADLREALANQGLRDVRTYVQSGNIVADWHGTPEELVELTHATIADNFGFDIPVTVRSGPELQAVVKRNPFPEQADSDPKHVAVTFLSAPPDRSVIAELEQVAAEGELIVAGDRELYTWHPQGSARSKLALKLSGKSLGADATARNWRTVTTLLELVSDD